MTQPKGLIEAVDRDGDGLYDFDEHCVWALLAPYDQRIKLKFSYIDVEEDEDCFYDFVEVKIAFPTRSIIISTTNQ